MQKIKEFSRPIFYTCISLLFACITILKQAPFLEYFPKDITFFYIALLLYGAVIIFAWIPKKFSRKIQIVCTAILFFLIPFIMECAVEMLNNNLIWDIDLFANIVMNYLINLLIMIIFYCVSGSFRIGAKMTSILLMVFGTVNMYVKLYKGSPFLPWDLTAISTATNVAGAFSYELYPQLLCAISLFLLSIVLSDFMSYRKKHIFYRVLRISGIAIVSGICIFYYGTDYFAKNFKATPDFFNQTRGYEAKGAIAEFIVNTKYLSLKEPDGYDVETLEDEIASYISDDVPSILETSYQHSGMSEEDIVEACNTEVVDHPNIIVIMNEAFSDLSVIGDFDTNQDYMPFINSLAHSENAISGNTYVSTIGTGTSNTEYEFLTGNTMGFLPIGSNAYQLYINHTQPSLVSTLKDQGYSADAFHPYHKKNWNRVSVYENMGFESFTDMDDMESYHKLRLFVSDASDFAEIESMYESRDTSKPFFLFNITMQNHSSYDQNANFTQQITLENMDREYPLTEQYLSLIKETDDEFANLISYFNNVNEPTIILMFGDHQPFIEDSFYEEVMGKKITELSDEEQQKRYITRFVLWANYDIPEAWIDEMSVNYLSTLLTQVAGLETTSYQDFLSIQFTHYPVISMMGVRDWSHTYSTIDEATSKSDIIQVYSHLAYNNVIEDEKRKNNLFYIKSHSSDS